SIYGLNLWIRYNRHISIFRGLHLELIRNEILNNLHRCILLFSLRWNSKIGWISLTSYFWLFVKCWIGNHVPFKVQIFENVVSTVVNDRSKHGGFTVGEIFGIS